MTDAQGNLSTILCVYNDVTTQREQEKKIREMMDDATANAELLTESEILLQGAAKIAADLTYRASIDEADPLVKLKVDYNTALDAIRRVLTDLTDAIKRLDTTIKDTIKRPRRLHGRPSRLPIAAERLTDNAKAKLSGVEKISSEMSEIFASIEEIASTSQDVTSHSERHRKRVFVQQKSGRLPRARWR